MKRTISMVLVLLMAGLGMVSAPVLAQEFSGNVALTTDYRFRGISQGDRDPAIQGGFDLEFENGFYAGTWASSVGFASSTEIDLYGGFAGDLTDDVAFDVAVLYYGYPEDNGVDFDGGDRDLDYFELGGSLSFYDATVGFYYSPDYFFETDAFIYLYGDYSFALAENWSLDFHYGLNMFDDEEVGADFGIGVCSAFSPNGECANGSEDSYSDWSVGVSTSAAGLDFSLQYIDTDLDDDDCFGGSSDCDSTAVFTVSKSL